MIKFLPVIVWLITAVVFMTLLAKVQKPFQRARKPLIGSPGFKKREFLLKISSMKSKEKFFDETDTPEVRALKRAYLHKFETLKAKTLKIFIIPVIGFGLMVIIAFVLLYFEKH